MSAPINIAASLRTELGRRANRRLRLTGRVPGVVYGHHEDVVSVALTKKELVAHLAHGAHVFDLAIEGKSEKVLVKEVQYDHFGTDLIHIDFARVDLNERVTVTVPIELKGDPIGEKDGGVLQQTLNELEIECVVTEIPDAIVVDVSRLEVDGALHVSDIKVAAGTVVFTDPDQLVCKVEVVTEEIADEAVDGSAEPEVIGKTAEEGEAAATAE